MKIVILVLVLLVCLTAVVHDNDAAIRRPNIDLMREVYDKVNRTRPSIVNAQENEAIIHNRLECYEDHPNYSDRLQVCNNQYLKDIVHVAREKIKSRPSIGLFVLNAGMCPVMHSICMGQTGGDMERCICFERQCIDYTLDTFWRGAAQELPQTYRLKR